jgi:hypothetical protein
MGLANMRDPKHLDLACNQVQDNMGLANMPDTWYLNLAVKEMIILSWHVQGNEVMWV